MSLKIALNETEVQAVKNISEIYTYRSVVETILTPEEKKQLDDAIDNELAKFSNPITAQIAHDLLKAEHTQIQRTMLWHLPIKIGDYIYIKDEKGQIQSQGIVTANPSGSCIPYDEPSQSVDAYVYNIDGSPFAINNDEHWVEIKGSSKYYKVPKKVYWG